MANTTVLRLPPSSDTMAQLEHRRASSPPPPPPSFVFFFSYLSSTTVSIIPQSPLSLSITAINMSLSRSSFSHYKLELGLMESKADTREKVRNGWVCSGERNQGHKCRAVMEERGEVGAKACDHDDEEEGFDEDESGGDDWGSMVDEGGIKIKYE
ncbi:hypothetical protein RIF29_20289 [Crotalaria pallida]|uniref:Uncharacterized protein n=1 Tax=Crotalaria pallida TaxID=3830 RepID=A0AAN9IC81_CROPI